MGMRMRVIMAVRMGVDQIAMPVLVSMDISVGMLMDVLMRMTMRMVVAVTVLAVVHWEVSLKRWNRRRCQQLAGEIWPLRLTFECFRTRSFSPI